MASETHDRHAVVVRRSWWVWMFLGSALSAVGIWGINHTDTGSANFYVALAPWVATTLAGLGCLVVALFHDDEKETPASRGRSLAEDLQRIRAQQPRDVSPTPGEVDRQPLAPASNDSGEAILALITRELRAGERRSRVTSWLQVVVGFALGIVGTLLTQALLPGR